MGFKLKGRILMKITKLSWCFHLLGLLALVLVFGVMFTGCDLSVITVGGGLLLGGIIGNTLNHVFIGIIVGGIIGFIVFLVISSNIGHDSSSSSSSNAASTMAIMERKRNEINGSSPRTCGGCSEYSTQRGLCKLHNKAESIDTDGCSDWR